MANTNRQKPSWDTTAPLKSWQSHETRALFENPWLRLEVTRATAPTGFACDYGVVRFANHAVAVLPLFEDGTVMLVGQMRFAFDSLSWELPEGGVPKDEAPLEGAKRELAEETGLLAQHWQEILKLDLSNSITDETGTCFLATGLSFGETNPDATEAFVHARVHFQEVLKSVISGEIRDSLTVATVLRVYHMAHEGALRPELARRILSKDT